MGGAPRTSERISSGRYNLEDVTWTGTRFLAVNTRGTLYGSPDGDTWTPTSAGDFERLTSNGSEILASNSSGIFHRSDGAGWQPSPLTSSGTTVHGLIWFGSVWLGNIGHTLYGSPDGVTWSEVSNELG